MLVNLETDLSNGKKYIYIPRSFLVINVCNQGKNLCALCIITEVFLYRNSVLICFRQIIIVATFN